MERYVYELRGFYLSAPEPDTYGVLNRRVGMEGESNRKVFQAAERARLRGHRKASNGSLSCGKLYHIGYILSFRHKSAHKQDCRSHEDPILSARIVRQNMPAGLKQITAVEI